jgi:beta-lactamase regulating signal transducer with metallopeptidase domain
MNGLGLTLFWSSVEVTFVALAALVLERLASRRGPRSASWVAAASLLVIVVLTPLAVCGLPAGLSWPTPSLNARAEPTQRDGSGTGAESSSVNAAVNVPARVSRGDEARGGLVWSPSWWRRFRYVAASHVNSIRQGKSIIPAAWSVIVLSGLAWGLVRLLLGLWGVRDCRLRSTSIDDPVILAEAELLRRELGITKVVEVRELSGPASTTAAAVGWRRPFVLLARDWQRWSGLERRTVLAHEMAHIARADYVLGVVAQLGLSLHFYHPLVHWMVGRLRLQQELAADALGARLAGGRRRYLVALSRLALRPEENLLSWPARTFLPTRGHLIRRIQMLKEQSPAQDPSMPAAIRVVTLAILIAVGMAAAAFRGSTPTRAAETPPNTASTSPTDARGFDLAYLPPNPAGVLAIRPAALARVPGLKSHFDSLSVALAQKVPGLPKFESIEQASIEFSVRPIDRSKKQPGRLVESDWMIRSVEDFDWKTLVKKLVKLDPNLQELVEIRLRDQVYYTAKRFQFVHSFYFPDARTVVFSYYEEHVRRLIQNRSSERPEFLRGNDWQQVERGLIAIAIDNSQHRWKLDASTDDPADFPVALLLHKASRWVAGVDAAEGMKLRAIATCVDGPQGETLARLVQDRLALARAALSGPANAGSPEKNREVEALVRTAKELLQACRVHREGAAVDLSAERKVEPDALAAIFRELF